MQMKKTYLTSKNRDELNIQMDYLKSNHKELRVEKEFYPIWFVTNDKIRVDNGRATTYWKLDFGNPGEIAAKRCTTFKDWVLLVFFSVIDVIVAYLIFCGGFTIAGMGVLLGVVLLQVLPMYFAYVMCPLMMLTRFVKKYLGAYK